MVAATRAPGNGNHAAAAGILFLSFPLQKFNEKMYLRKKIMGTLRIILHYFQASGRVLGVACSAGGRGLNAHHTSLKISEEKQRLA